MSFIINPNRFQFSFADSLEFEVTVSNETITIPTGQYGDYQGYIDWGDDTILQFSSYDDSNLSHTYTSGTYTIKIAGTFSQFNVNNGVFASLVTGINSFGKVGLTYINLYGCSNITGTLPELPETLLVIPENGFRELSSISGNLTIPERITSIGNRAFRDCGFDGTLTISSSTADFVNIEIFYNCNFTGSLTIPEGITTIGSACFQNCNFTGSLSLPSTLTSVTGFYNAGFTGSLTIPSSVTNIGTGAFRATGFTGPLNLPSGLETLGSYSFQDCSGLTGDITIPSTITTIPEAAFRACSGFDGTLTLDASVTHLNNFAFYLCTSINRVDAYPSTAPSLDALPINLGGDARPLHIPADSSGYDVAPWTTTSIFSSIINDL